MNVKKDKAKTQKGRIEKQGETARQKRGYEKERKRRENGIREIEKDRRRARERNEMHLVLEVGEKEREIEEAGERKRRTRRDKESHSDEGKNIHQLVYNDSLREPADKDSPRLRCLCYCAG